MQGQNEASLHTYRETVLYLCASYNFAGGWAKGLSRPPVSEGSTGERDHSQSLWLYTLGRIFEQSITELEILEAEADGRPSINIESKRKRDGVYYTPEWVVERIVEETLRPRLDEIKRECGWPANKLPKKEAIDAFIARLKTLTIVDQACGSGAFLITTLRYLLDTWHAVRELRKSVTGEFMTEDDAGLVRDILKSNVYGVDINSAKRELEAEAPSILDIEGRLAWAAKQYGDTLEALHEAIGQRLNPGTALDAAIADGELSFSIDGVTVIDRIFESGAEGTFIVAQRKVLATTFSITERTAGKKLCDALRKLATNDSSAVVLQIMALERELASLDAEIARQEREMNALVYGLYGLSAEEIEMVEKG